MGKTNIAGMESGWHVTKKVAYILAFLVVASIVIVGLIVYYAGISSVVCVPNGQSEAGKKSDDEKKVNAA